MLIAKSPTLRGPTCQGVLGLVFVCTVGGEGDLPVESVGGRWVSPITRKGLLGMCGHALTFLGDFVSLCELCMLP